MKKICYVVTISATIRAFFVPQLKYLANNGFDVTVICSNDSSLQRELGQEVHYLPVDIPRGISLTGSIRAVSRLIKIFRKEKFDLIQYSTPNAALCSSIAAKIVGAKVRNYHLMGYRYLGVTGVNRSILKMLEKVTCTLSTNIECVSKSNLRLGIQEKLFSQDKAIVVWNGSTGGVDLERFDSSHREEWRRELRKELGYAEEDFIFGFVGRITKDKGINELLKAFLEERGESKLFLIGNIEKEESLDRDLLQQARKSLNVMFHASVADIQRYYAMIDVLVLPSYREGFGNVVIEAAAVGTPAIVSNIPGPIDAIEEGKTGITFEHHDAEALQMAMSIIKRDISEYSKENCVDFIKTRFDDKILRKKILKQKERYFK